MLFSMMRLTMLSYHLEGDEPPEFRGKSLDMAANFRNVMAQCLMLADYTKPYRYLIETMVFHLHGDFRQTKEANVSIWILVGVIARLAMRMGYHRDSKMFPNITPFHGEMRRRIWTFVRQADLLFSFQLGLPSMLRSADSDTELPRNLYDDDFDEDCKELSKSAGLEESDTEQVTKSFGIMKVDNNKSYYISDAHWASVLNDVSSHLGHLLLFLF